MDRLNSTLIILLTVIFSSCASPKYQKAKRERGYLDKKVSANTYLVEYSWKGGLSWITSCDKNMEKLETYWTKRATELCPCGFEGKPTLVRAKDSKFEDFNSSRSNYRAEPVATGEAVCNVCPPSKQSTAQ